MNFVLGLDLGQVKDFSAVAIAERLEYERVWAIRYLERFPLGTSYPAIVAKVRFFAGRYPLRDNVHLAVDATGVGRPVVDLLREARLGRYMHSITIHGGEKVTLERDPGGYRVPKRDLISNLQVLFQRHRLNIAPELPLAEIFLKELENFRVDISEAGHDTYGAARSGDHDDLVLAAALACWLGQRFTALPSSPPVPRPPSAPMSPLVKEFFESLEKGTDPDLFPAGDYRPSRGAGAPVEIRQGVTGTVVRTKR